MVDTWALKGCLYAYFGVYVCTEMILGPFGNEPPSMASATVDDINPALPNIYIYTYYIYTCVYIRI